MALLPDPRRKPVAARIMLGTSLRELRESAGMTPRQAARTIGGSTSKISRIELGRHPARETDVADLITSYGLTDQANKDELLALASVAASPPWWQHYADLLPAWFWHYLGLEEAAETVRVFETSFIPGLLQTDEYAAQLALLRVPGLTARVDQSTAARLNEVRAKRAACFTTGGGALECVIDEAALRRLVGSRRVQREQLRHLAQAASTPGVTVRISELAAPPPAAPAGFTLLRFAGQLLPDQVCIEHHTGASFHDRSAETSRYARKLEELRCGSAPASQTGAIIERLLAQLR
jgi:transcriptional regulator with XRE-family HTH domain